ncbi:YfiR family protein [Gammaproteobacteria bacterium]|nr:YfiR family protein [Gammaproteobacteria bacterium]
MISRCSHKYRLLVLVMLLLGNSSQSSENELSREYKIKATYLLNISRYADWPNELFFDSQSDFIMCLQPDSIFSSFLREIVSGEVVTDNNRKIVVNELENIRDIAHCNLLYLKEYDLALKEFNCNCVFIGNTTEYSELGSNINFFTERERVRFEVNVTRLNETGISLQSELLRLARIIRE